MVFPQWIRSGLLAAVQVEQTRMRAKSVCFMPDHRTVPSWTRQPRKEHEVTVGMGCVSRCDAPV